VGDGMTAEIELGFSMEPVSVPFSNILSSRSIPDNLSTSRKFIQIRSSIKEIGLIEPLSITPIIKKTDHHMLLDGHMRLIAMRELGFNEAPCLVAKDDESYTYNSRINRLSTIQEHFMIRRAIERGVSANRLAEVLSVDISHIYKKMTLLNGICPEAVDLLKDRQFSAEISRVLRKMKPTRQIECVELMTSANMVNVPYAEAMFAATPVELLVDGKKPMKLAGISQEQMGKMEREMSSLQGQYKIVEQTYGRDVLNLVLARGYLVKLLDNASIARYLGKNCPEILVEFEAIVKTVALD
jgi:hypothetical protein